MIYKTDTYENYIKQISSSVECPLVLHGGSVLSDDDFRCEYCDIPYGRNRGLYPVALPELAVSHPDALSGLMPFKDMIKK